MSKEPTFLTNPKHIEAWLAAIGMKGYTIQPNGLVDVAGRVNLKGRLGNLTHLPVRFGKVGGGFDCENNQLVSLEGSPKEVGGYFACHNNQLVSLEGSPKEVGGGFDCHSNQLVSLEGSPEKVGGDFWCLANQLVNLEGSPEKVGGNFSCNFNQLVSLEGSPKEVGGYFDCHNNELVNLEGSPKEVGGDFYCYGNNLVAFVGFENTKIGADIYPIWHPDLVELPEGKADNTIVSLKGLREEYYGKVKGLDVEAIKVRELDTSLDIMV